MSFNPVKPGDLITAAYFNQVLGSFDTRISALEASAVAASTAIVITGLSPTGPLNMGNVVTVLGQNFGLPAQAMVSVAGVSVSGSSFLPGSGNNALVFQIPPVQGVPSSGQVATITVSNPTSTSSPYSFTLLPAAITVPTGQIGTSMTSGPSATTQITAGGSYIFVFTITSSTDLTDVYSLAVSLDAASSAAGWTAGAVDAGGNAISQISIPQGQSITTPVNVQVKIPAAPLASSSAQVTLTVTSTTNPTGIVPASASVIVTVGAAPPPPNLIGIAVAGVTVRTPTGLPPATFSGTSSITLPAGTTSAVVTLSVQVPDTAPTTKYVCTGPTFGASGWGGSVLATDCPFFGQSTAVTVHVNITSVPTGSASTTMTFQVQESGKTSVAGQIAPTISV
jgi:hypothetical protein